MAYSAFKVGAVSAEKRRSSRQDVWWKGMIHDDQGSMIAPCFMTNVSASGAKLIIEAGVNVPDGFVLAFARNSRVRRECEVVWRSARTIGVRFVTG